MNIAAKNIYAICFILFSLLMSVQIFSQTTINYESSDEIFINPERGFSAYRSSSITQTLINSLKLQNVSLIQRIYTIPQYNSVPLPQTFLDLVHKDLTEARTGGVKVVLRFSYTNRQTGADAALDTILLHIEQLTPVLRENSDVIAYVEAGFIGAWGEWYYSSHFLNKTPARRSVLYALLNALPQNRSVVIRTPDYKRKIFNITEPLDYDDAFNGSMIARTGAHNDCFLANATDYGTYLNIEEDKNFLNLDNRFVPQGGETCCDCGYAGCAAALKDLERLHWSVLNKDYHEDVLKRWETEGCMDEVKRRLGYRFHLIQASLQDSIRPSGKFHLEFQIANTGFASPYNPRNLEIILREKNTGIKYRLLADGDPRLWMSGDTVNVTITAGAAKNMPEGEYEMYLFLADPEPRLHDRKDYAIRLANTGLWEDSTGYNSLNHSLIVSESASGEDYSGEKYFEIYSGTTSVNDEDYSVPEEYRINAYPNPFNGSATISFNINPDEITDMRIMDILGQSVRQFDFAEYGKKKIIWNAGNHNSGIYFITITTKKNIYSTKLMFLK